MVEAGTLCINADVLKKAGLRASATSIDEAYTNVYIKEAEGQICGASRYDWVTNYDTISDIGKEILRDATSAYAAMLVTNYDTSGYNTQEPLLGFNLHWASFQKFLTLVEKDNNYKDFILTGVGDID